MASKGKKDPTEQHVDPGSDLLAITDTKSVNWDQQLGFLLHDVSRLRRIVFDEYMKPAGITRSQWWVLAYLSRYDGIIQTDLAAMLDIGKAALGGLIDRLEAAEFIERRPDTDRRAKRLYVSAKGRKIVREIISRSHDMSERILSDLDHDERVQLAEMLLKVKNQLIAIKGD